MLRTFLLTLCTLVGGGLYAAPIVTLQPAEITGTAGSVVGWSVEVTSDPLQWITFTSSFVLVETGSLGSYQDFLGPIGGPSDGFLAPNSGPWLLDYNFASQTGLGAYFIDPLVVVGASASGTIRILYEAFTDDPLTCGDCYFGSGSLDVDYSVTVSAEPVPEPATAGCVIGAALLLIGLRKKKA
jgi:hypothetical protein